MDFNIASLKYYHCAVPINRDYLYQLTIACETVKLVFLT